MNRLLTLVRFDFVLLLTSVESLICTSTEDYSWSPSGCPHLCSQKFKRMDRLLILVRIRRCSCLSARTIWVLCLCIEYWNCVPLLLTILCITVRCITLFLEYWCRDRLITFLYCVDVMLDYWNWSTHAMQCLSIEIDQRNCLSIEIDWTRRAAWLSIEINRRDRLEYQTRLIVWSKIAWVSMSRSIDALKFLEYRYHDLLYDTTFIFS